MQNNIAPTQGFRLSPLQTNLWLKVKEASTPFVTRSLVSVEGKINADLLKAAISDVVSNHEILRTTFQTAPNGSEPIQVIHASSAPDFTELNFCDVAAEEQQHRINDLFQQAGEFNYAPLSSSLLRVSIVILSPAKQALLIALPALCGDLVGMQNLIQEIALNYSARVDGQQRIAEMMQYADVAEWQFDLLAGEDGELGRTFWRDRMLGKTKALRLPLERTSANTNAFTPGATTQELSVQQFNEVKKNVEKFGASLESFFLACFVVLLWRLSGEDTVTIGAGFDGRKFDELKETLGLFSRYLPLTCQPTVGMNFPELLSRIEGSLSEMAEWQDFFNPDNLNGSFAEASDTAYFPFCFDFAKAFSCTAGGVSFTVQKQQACVDRCKLRLVSEITQDSAKLQFHFDETYYHADDMQRLSAEFLTLVESVLAAPATAIDRLNLLSAPEKQYLIHDFNNTKADFPTDKCIHHVIEDQVAKTPNKIAAAFEGEELIYAALNEQANQLARRLRCMGVGPDVLVGISLERSLEMVVAVLAILKAGGAYVPLDPAYPKERLEYMLEETAAPVLLTKQRFVGQLPLQGRQIFCMDTDWQSLADESTENLHIQVKPGNLVYVIYTSGSTGKPKGVVISHQDLVISNSARISYFKENIDKFLLLSSLSFDSSVVGIFWTLCTGGALFLVPEETQQDVTKLSAIISQHNISHLLTLPSFYSVILEYAEPGQLEALRTVIVAGEACPLKMVQLHKSVIPATALFSEYGATETTVFSSVYDCLQQVLKIAPVGSPINNAQMYVLDAHCQPTPVGVPGEVYFGGDALATGYLNRSELTAERFIPNPFSEKAGERLYRSGDLARHLPNGDIEFLGRVDNQVKIRGFRVEMEEIEAVLALHPLLREVAVVANDAASGKRLVAYVAVSGEQNPGSTELRNFLAERLPDYMVPAIFVVLPTLPKNPNGKIDRQALPEPPAGGENLAAQAVEPRTEIENKLARIWGDVLGIVDVGVHDNFFELGGDSILSIQIIARANRAGLGLTPAQVFQHQTIAELAAVAGERHKVTAEQAAVTGILPLSPIQSWFFQRQLENPHHFNMSLLFVMNDDISDELLQAVMQRLAVHHDGLRLRYNPENAWQQAIVDAGDVIPFDRIDLSDVPIAQQMTVLRAKVVEFQSTLDITRGPVMRLVRFDFGSEQPHRLLWVVHHLVMDGVSWRIFLDDFEAVVAQLAQGGSLQLQPKTTSFKHWVMRLTEHAQSESVAGELDYWQSALPQDMSHLPLDMPEGVDNNVEDSAEKISLQLQAEETQSLLHEIPKVYNTQINDILLTALAQALLKWTGNSSHLVDLESHGREDVCADVDLTRTVGWFTTFYPILLSVEKNAAAGDMLTAIKEQLRRVPNRGFNYGLLRYLNTDKNIATKVSALPRPQINFNYLGQYDQILSNDSVLSFSEDVSHSDFCPSTIRSHILEIVGSVIDGRFQIEWVYSRNLHKRETIAAVANDFISALKSLISHCQTEQSVGFTASDFSDFDWDRAELDEIAAAILKSKSEA